MQEINDYIIDLDNIDINMINMNVAEKGIECYLSQQLIYLDCTRIYSNGMRAMQTIGYPYRRELSAYLYALENQVNFLTVEDSDVSKFNEQEWIDKLLKRHQANLEFEKDNPPIWYDKKHKNKWNKQDKSKLPRKRKYVEQHIPGLNASERLKQRAAEFGKLTFKLNKHKENG